jgi:hypothetical protein
MNLLPKGLGAPTTELSGSARLACEKCELNVRAGARRHVVARRHHFVTLRGVVTPEVCHAADGRNARRAPAARSLRANIQRVNGAHGGLCSREEWVSGGRASALKLPDLCREKNDEGVTDFQFATGSRDGQNGRHGVDPKRRSRGAIGARTGARASDELGRRVVRLTGGLRGLTGFDVAGGSDSTVSAALDCRKRRATYDCERQRGSRSGCGLSDAGARGARVARRRHHTSLVARRRRRATETLTVVEAPTPRRQEQPVALNPATHVSESSYLIVADRGSIPRGSTTSAHGTDAIAACGLCSKAVSRRPGLPGKAQGADIEEFGEVQGRIFRRHRRVPQRWMRAVSGDGAVLPNGSSSESGGKGLQHRRRQPKEIGAASRSSGAREVCLSLRELSRQASCGSRPFAGFVRRRGVEILQGRGTVPRRAHNAKAAGSTPAPATTETVPLVGGSTHGGSAERLQSQKVASRTGSEPSNVLGQLPRKVGGLRVRLLQTELLVTKEAQAIEGRESRASRSGPQGSSRSIARHNARPHH